MIIPWQVVLGAYIGAGIIAFVAGIYIGKKSNEFIEKSEYDTNEEEKYADLDGAIRFLKIVNK